MKKLIILIVMILSIPAFSTTELGCYKSYFKELKKLHYSTININLKFFNKETGLLDIYFNPGKYIQGAFIPLQSEAKKKLFDQRDFFATRMNVVIKNSQMLSNGLEKCLYKVGKNAAQE